MLKSIYKILYNRKGVNINVDLEELTDTELHGLNHKFLEMALLCNAVLEKRSHQQFVDVTSRPNDLEWFEEI